MSQDADLRNVEALVFDVFGTTLDWHGSIVEELASIGQKKQVDGDWSNFAKTWRRGYIEHVQKIAQGNASSLTMDELHRELLEKMLLSSEWKHLGTVLDAEERTKLNNIWHRLQAWSDAPASISALKKEIIVGALSNGNSRLLIDLAKFTELSWDFVFSSELFGSMKPDIKVYQGAMKQLSLEPEKCAMIATHAWDLRGAAKAGMKTVYVARNAQEPIGYEEVKAKSEGGEVDLVFNSFTDLAVFFSRRKM
ncbi:Haloacid type II [Favolaschia claudopus]|uniref:Haloacid type II n=1 Tax=Favolaschia claudopus TaxID=2862362 RepID=A0AAV9ZV32_9AGAR